MNFLNIIKYKFLIHIRLQYGVTAKKITKYLPNISSTYIYILSFILQIQSSIFLCFCIQSFTQNTKILFYIFSVISIFFILSCSTMGRQASKKTSIIEDENILLHSRYSDKQIFLLISIEEFFKVLIDDIVIFIPCVYLLCFFSLGIIDYIIKFILFLIVNIVVFVISNILINRKINKNLYDNKLKVYFQEIFYYIKYIFILYSAYLLSEIIILPIIKQKLLLYNSIETFKIINDSIKDNINFQLQRIINIKNNIFDSISILNLKANIINELILIALLILICYLILILNSIEYRKNKSGFYTAKNYKKKFFHWYLQGLLLINKFIFKDDFFVKKDIQILKQKSDLLINYEVSSFIIPLVSTVNLGILIFLSKYAQKTLIINIFLIIFVVIFLFDITSIIKSRIPIIISINSELRNINLIKNSTYSIKNLIESKIKLLRLFMIIPSIITIIQTIYFLTKINLNIKFIISISIIGICMFIIVPRLQLYGDIFFDKFNYKNYEEFYENIHEQKIYKKFFTIPKIIIIMPLIVILGVSLVFNIPEKIFIGMLIYILFISLVFYLISIKILNKGVKNFYEKILEVE